MARSFIITSIWCRAAASGCEPAQAPHTNNCYSRMTYCCDVSSRGFESLYIKHVSYGGFVNGGVVSVLFLKVLQSDEWLSELTTSQKLLPYSKDAATIERKRAKPGIVSVASSVLQNKTRQTNRRMHRWFPGFLHPLLVAPSDWSSAWVPEVGRTKRKNSGPVPFSTFNERSVHAGVKVQVEQFSSCTHARFSMKE